MVKRRKIKLKILFITPNYEPAWHLGGIVHSSSKLCQALHDIGHEVTVFTTDSGKYHRLNVPLNKEINVRGVKVYYFKTDISLKFAYSPLLKKACKEMMGKYDIVYLSSIWHYPEYPGGYFARKYNIPYIVKVAGALHPHGLSKSKIRKYLYLNLIEYRNLLKSNAIHYTTLMERENAPSKLLNVPSFILGNGITIGEIPSPSEKILAREYFDIPQEAFVAGFLGRIEKIKNLENLIKAISIVRKLGINSYLIIGGPDFGEEEWLKSMVNNLGLGNYIKFFGYIHPSIRNLFLSASDFIALPSFQENFGNVAAEGMATSRPVLISNKVGLYKEVEIDKAGLVVGLDAKSIANGIELFALNSNTCNEMGINAYWAAKKRYDIKSIANRMELAILDILNGTRGAELYWSGD